MLSTGFVESIVSLNVEGSIGSQRGSQTNSTVDLKKKTLLVILRVLIKSKMAEMCNMCTLCLK